MDITTDDDTTLLITVFTIFEGYIKVLKSEIPGFKNYRILMTEKIRKLLKYFIVLLGIIIMLPTIFYFLIRLPDVQTMIVKRITGHFSSEIKSTITIGRFDYSFFNRLVINDILIKDKNDDTLAYIPRLTAGIRSINLKNNSFTIGHLDLYKPVIGLITDTTGIMNLTWYLQILNREENTDRKKNSKISISRIELTDGRFSLINRNSEKKVSAIDFGNLHISDLNGVIEDLDLYNDTTSLTIYKMNFREEGGLTVNTINGDLLMTEGSLLFKSVFISSDSSIINIPHLGLVTDSAGSFRNFTNDVRIDLLFDKSQISTTDIRHFIASSPQIPEPLTLSGRVFGTISELRGRNIQVSFGRSSFLDCVFDFSGLPQIDNSFIYVGINTLRSRAEDFENIYIPGKGTFRPPQFLYKIGTINFDGSFTGFTTDFVAYGKIRSDFGNLSTDISFRPDESNSYRINGLVTASDVNLGLISGNPDLFGKISLRTDVDGLAKSLKQFSANLNGLIDSLEINNYVYRNIALNGLFNEKTWDGSIRISEDNIKLDFLGMLKIGTEIPEFDFNLNLKKFNLYSTNFDRNDTTSSLSMLLTANFKGNNIDNLDGEIKLVNSQLTKFGTKLDLNNFSIRTFSENNLPAISLRTDFIDADLRGSYNFSGLKSVVISALSSMMPSRLIAQDRTAESEANNFSFNVNFRNTDKINSFFRTGIMLSENSYLTGTLISDSIFKVKGEAKSLSVKKGTFKDLTFETSYLLPDFSVRLNSSSLKLSEQSEMKGFKMSFSAIPDNFKFELDWDNNNENNIRNKGSFIASGLFTRKIEQDSTPILIITIDSTDIYSRNNLWKIRKSEVLLDSNALNINNLYISSAERFYRINGSVSESPTDTLHLQFKGIDINPVNYLLRKNDVPDQIPLAIKGELNGNIILTNLYQNPLIGSDLKINNFSILESNFGDLSVKSDYDIEKKVADIDAGADLNGRRLLDIKGLYDPSSREVNLNLKADKLPVEGLNPLLRVFASGISGTASGKAKLSGELNKLVLEGSLLTENATMKIDYLQTRYRFNDSIRFAKDRILFRNIRLADDRGNIATLNGSVNHKFFKQYSADLMINTNEAMVLNTRQKDNELFYGTAFATGVTTIKSGPSSLTFDISARTDRNTRFYIPLNTSETVSDYSFITFIKPDTIFYNEATTAGHSQISQSTALDLTFDLEVTPDAEVQLIFDSKIGDVMKGRGSGNLNINLEKNGNFGISGDYIIEDGDYLFTLGNILNKSFTVENGGTISFNGDIDNAEINIRAIYNLKTSLKEIIPIPDEKYSERIPVECQINLSGKLFNPLVGLNIELPTADEQTRAYLKNAITTEEELSRQFLYLLVMNSFYSDPSYGSSLSASTTTGTSAMAVTTTEMVSNQLSNWLSQISNDFDIGFVYRPGSTGSRDINSQEVQVALSTQLLNDRVTINGNFDVRGAGGVAGNTDQITGDFDLEYRITEKIRFKVFNRYNDAYTGKQDTYTQGFGIFFRQDFDRFSDLFRNRQKSEMKKEEEPVVSENFLE